MKIYTVLQALFAIVLIHNAGNDNWIGMFVSIVIIYFITKAKYNMKPNKEETDNGN